MKSNNKPIVKLTKKQEMASEMTLNRLKQHEELRLKMSKEFSNQFNKQTSTNKQKENNNYNNNNRIPLSHRNYNKKNNNNNDNKIKDDNNENKYGNIENTLDLNSNNNMIGDNKITSIVNSNSTKMVTALKQNSSSSLSALPNKSNINSNSSSIKTPSKSIIRPSHANNSTSTKSNTLVEKAPVKLPSKVLGSKTTSKILHPSSKILFTNTNTTNKLCKKNINVSSKVNINRNTQPGISLLNHSNNKKNRQKIVIANATVLDNDVNIGEIDKDFVNEDNVVKDTSHGAETHSNEPPILIQDPRNIDIFPINESILKYTRNFTPFASIAIALIDTVNSTKDNDIKIGLKENVDKQDFIKGKNADDSNENYEESYEESIEDSIIEDSIIVERDTTDFKEYPIDSECNNDSNKNYDDLVETSIVDIDGTTSIDDVVGTSINYIDIREEEDAFTSDSCLYGSINSDVIEIDSNALDKAVDPTNALEDMGGAIDTYSVSTKSSTDSCIYSVTKLRDSINNSNNNSINDTSSDYPIEFPSEANLNTTVIIENLSYSISIDNEKESLHKDEQIVNKEIKNELNEEDDILKKSNICIEVKIIDDDVINKDTIDISHSGDNSCSVGVEVASIKEKLLLSTCIISIDGTPICITNDNNISIDISGDYVTSNENNSTSSSRCSSEEYVTSNDYEDDEDNGNNIFIKSIMNDNSCYDNDTSIVYSDFEEINNNNYDVNINNNNRYFSPENINNIIIKKICKNDIFIAESKCYKNKYRLRKIIEKKGSSSQSVNNLSPCPFKGNSKKSTKNKLLKDNNNNNNNNNGKDFLIMNDIGCDVGIDDDLTTEERVFRRFNNTNSSFDSLRRNSCESSVSKLNSDNKRDNCSSCNSNGKMGSIQILQALKEYISTIDSIIFAEELNDNEDNDKENELIEVNEEVIVLLNDMVDTIHNDINDEVILVDNCKIDTTLVDDNFQSPIKNLIDDVSDNKVSPIFKSSKEKIIEPSNNPIINTKFIDPAVSKLVNTDVTSISKLDEIISNTATNWLPFSYEIQLAISTNKLKAMFQGRIARFGYVEFILKISTRSSQRPMDLLIFRRYSDFEDLYYKLFDIYREDKNINKIPLPIFPSKQYLSSVYERWKNTAFLIERQRQLEVWLDIIVNKIAGESTLYRTALQDFLVTQVSNYNIIIN
jgi:hypothetical protein